MYVGNNGYIWIGEPIKARNPVDTVDAEEEESAAQLSMEVWRVSLTLSYLHCHIEALSHGARFPFVEHDTIDRVCAV